jgi:hypothetical protein
VLTPERLAELRAQRAEAQALERQAEAWWAPLCDAARDTGRSLAANYLSWPRLEVLARERERIGAGPSAAALEALPPGLMRWSEEPRTWTAFVEGVGEVFDLV